MRRDDKFRFSLGWSRDTAEKIAVGDLLERLKNRKSDLVVQAVWEYIGNHPEVMTEDAKIVISVHPKYDRRLVGKTENYLKTPT